MARTNLDDHIKAGLLTAPSVSQLIPMSRTTVSNLSRRGLIPRIVTPGIRETRYSALEIIKYCVENRLPYNPRLLEAAKNYAMSYHQEDKLEGILGCQLFSTL